MYTCSTCGCEYPRTDEYFNRHPQTVDGLRPDCKWCDRDDASKAYYNNQMQILDKRYQDYHDPANIEAKRAYFAQKRREYRARQREALAQSA